MQDCRSESIWRFLRRRWSQESCFLEHSISTLLTRKHHNNRTVANYIIGQKRQITSSSSSCCSDEVIFFLRCLIRCGSQVSNRKRPCLAHMQCCACYHRIKIAIIASVVFFPRLAFYWRINEKYVQKMCNNKQEILMSSKSLLIETRFNNMQKYAWTSMLPLNECWNLLNIQLHSCYPADLPSLLVLRRVFNDLCLCTFESDLIKRREHF